MCPREIIPTRASCSTERRKKFFPLRFTLHGKSPCAGLSTRNLHKLISQRPLREKTAAHYVSFRRFVEFSHCQFRLLDSQMAGGLTPKLCSFSSLHGVSGCDTHTTCVQVFLSQSGESCFPSSLTSNRPKRASLVYVTSWHCNVQFPEFARSHFNNQSSSRQIPFKKAVLQSQSSFHSLAQCEAVNFAVHLVTKGLFKWPCRKQVEKIEKKAYFCPAQKASFTKQSKTASKTFSRKSWPP